MNSYDEAATGKYSGKKNKLAHSLNMAPFIIFSTNFLSIYITIFVYSTIDGDTSMCPLSCHKISLTKLYLYSIFHHLLSSNIVYKFPRVGEFS